jgi:plastocyanin
VSLTDFNVEPATLVVEPGTRVILAVSNEGGEDHDLAAEDGNFATPVLEPGESHRLDLGVVGEAHAICTLPLHEFLGMKMEIRVSTE